MLFSLAVVKLISFLCRILFDSRHDWPSNGAALALLQYAHLGLSNADFFAELEQERILEAASDFLEVCKNKETKRHLYELLTIMNIGKKKMNSIEYILKFQAYAAAA